MMKSVLLAKELHNKTTWTLQAKGLRMETASLKQPDKWIAKRITVKCISKGFWIYEIFNEDMESGIEPEIFWFF